MEENNLNAVNDAQEVNVEPQNTEKPSQTRAENSAFASMRRRENQAVMQREAALKENEKLTEELSSYKSQIGKDSEELESLREFKNKRLIEDDIALIKKEYPEFEISPNNLPEDYIRIMATGAVDALTAAEIILARRKKAALNAPAPIGAVNEVSDREKDFYTPEEVDRLTKEDFKKDPKLLKRIQRSMTKWR